MMEGTGTLESQLEATKVSVTCKEDKPRGFGVDVTKILPEGLC